MEEETKEWMMFLGIGVVCLLVFIFSFIYVVSSKYVEDIEKNKLKYPHLYNYSYFCQDIGYDEYFDDDVYDNLFGKCYSSKYGEKQVGNTLLSRWRQEKIKEDLE